MRAVALATAGRVARRVLCRGTRAGRAAVRVERRAAGVSGLGAGVHACVTATRLDAAVGLAAGAEAGRGQARAPAARACGALARHWVRRAREPRGAGGRRAQCGRRPRVVRCSAHTAATRAAAPRRGQRGGA
eukprot:355625-Chlamydomonas_euryale.AAC.4